MFKSLVHKLAFLTSFIFVCSCMKTYNNNWHTNQIIVCTGYLFLTYLSFTYSYCFAVFNFLHLIQYNTHVRILCVRVSVGGTAYIYWNHLLISSIINLWAAIDKIINGLASVETEDILTPADSRTRKNHSFKFKHLQANCDSYRYSFFPATISSWNNLPFGIEKVDSVEGFKLKLKEHTFRSP